MQSVEVPRHPRDRFAQDHPRVATGLEGEGDLLEDLAVRPLDLLDRCPGSECLRSDLHPAEPKLELGRRFVVPDDVQHDVELTADVTDGSRYAPLVDRGDRHGSRLARNIADAHLAARLSGLCALGNNNRDGGAACAGAGHTAAGGGDCCAAGDAAVAARAGPAGCRALDATGHIHGEVSRLPDQNVLILRRNGDAERRWRRRRRIDDLYVVTAGCHPDCQKTGK